MPVGQQQQQQQQKQIEGKVKRLKKGRIPIVYPVTSSRLAPATKDHYEKDINRFLAHFKIKNIVPLKEYPLKDCKQMIIDYVIHLRENTKLSHKSIKMHLAGIRYLFYMIRDDEFPIRWTKVVEELPPQEYTHRDRGYSVDEIQKMIEVGSQGRLREKTIILLLTSAGGMRIGGIPRLKKGDLKEMRTSQGEKTYGIRIYSESTENYFTPCSPECAAAIDRYLEQRTQDNEKLGYDSPLIRNYYNSLNVRVVKPLTLSGMRYVVRAIVRISGVRNRFEFKGEVQMSRGFRKFYKSEADQSGMLPATVELTQGHSIGVPGHYLRLKDTEILRDYEKVIDRITLDPSHRLKKRVDELETEKDNEIANLKVQLQAREQRFREVDARVNRIEKEFDRKKDLINKAEHQFNEWKRIEKASYERWKAAMKKHFQGKGPRPGDDNDDDV